MSTITDNIRIFEKLMKQVNRNGADKLVAYLKNETDFYKAPASTQFHLSCEGGLLQHSINVLYCLLQKKGNPLWKEAFNGLTDENLIVMALLHDICKVNCYVAGTKNQKTYDAQKVKDADSWAVKHDSMGDFIWETIQVYNYNDTEPLGHGEKSVMMIMRYMSLTEAEMYAIRWHMGYTVNREDYNAVSLAMEKHPIVLALHEADLEASKIIEKTDGNRLEITL